MKACLGPPTSRDSISNIAESSQGHEEAGEMNHRHGTFNRADVWAFPNKPPSPPRLGVAVMLFQRKRGSFPWKTSYLTLSVFAEGYAEGDAGAPRRETHAARERNGQREPLRAPRQAPVRARLRDWRQLRAPGGARVQRGTRGGAAAEHRRTSPPPPPMVLTPGTTCFSRRLGILTLVSRVT